MTDGYTVIDKIIPGGAADKQGELKVGDRIVSVGQGDEGRRGRCGRNEAQRRREADSRQGGHDRPAGRHSRPTAASRRSIKITRAKIELKDSEARGAIIEEGKKADGTPFKIGVIDLPSFYMDMEAAREGNGRLQELHPRRAADSRRLQQQGRRCRRARPAPQRRRQPDRGDQPDRPVHRRGPGGAGEGPRRPTCSSTTTSTAAWPGRARWSC